MLRGFIGSTWLLAGALALVGCGQEGSTSNPADADPADADPADTAPTTDGGGGADTPVLAATCTPEGEKHYAEPDVANHVTSLAGQRYNSTPPSSGSHCPIWGRRGNYTAAKPLLRCNWLHNLEHGWVVLLYRCAGDCPDVVAALQAAAKAAPTDPECASDPRIIITPDPELDVPVAAVAWRYTWKSTCLDAPAQASLAKFIGAHIGSRGEAYENFCDDGGIGP